MQDLPIPVEIVPVVSSWKREESACSKSVALCKSAMIQGKITQPRIWAAQIGFQSLKTDTKFSGL